METTKNAQKIPTDVRPYAAASQLGSALRSERESRGWTLERLAKTLQVTKGYVSRLEGGKARPAAKMIERLAKTWQIDPAPLLILAGHVPADVREILQNHPVEAPTMLRDSFGEGAYDKTLPAASSFTVRESHASYVTGKPEYKLVEDDCFSWLAQRDACSIHAVVTDPPYGLKEYTPEETSKLRLGRGGVWRIPPALGGCTRQPVPRFTVLSEEERRELGVFFSRWAKSVLRVLVPGGHVFIATNPLLSHLVYVAMMEAGFEKRGEIIRLVQTLRGGDRPKNAHKEFEDVTVMPRSCWEPWGLFRKPCEGRVLGQCVKIKISGRIETSCFHFAYRSESRAGGGANGVR